VAQGEEIAVPAADGRIVVLGGGVAGLATALLLARSGRQVVVIERDDLDFGAADESPEWRRKGIPHFRQPHQFIPRGRAELMSSLPDVYEELLRAGARDVDVRRKLPGTLAPSDEIFQYLAVRRPLIEWGLRRATAAEPAIEVRAQQRVTGLAVDDSRVTGARIEDEVIDASLVVDAMGRRSPTPEWLAAAGLAQPMPDTSDCGVTYFCRYYRCRPGFEPPDGPWLLSPRGDIGYLAYASFPGDNATFAGLLAVPPGESLWRAFQQPNVFEAAVATIPALASWVNPSGVDPITDVLPMAGLRNSLRNFDPRTSPGLVPVGDALAHTDPVLAHGLAFALIHARELATALSTGDAVDDAAAAYASATAAGVRERYAFATALDEQRLRLWRGEPVDFAHRDGDYALFSMVAAGAAAMVDPEVFRVFVSRIGLLDSTAVLDDDVDLQRRIEELFAEIMAKPRPPAGPTRLEMEELVARTKDG
jgi:2-polyprenyl-6-methoxyphenol hydroxylase-like FAD-dependent oxidoreductase